MGYRLVRIIPPPEDEIRGIEFRLAGHSDGWTMVVHRSTIEPGRWQVSTIAPDGPWGHTTRDTLAEAVQLANEDGGIVTAVHRRS